MDESPRAMNQLLYGIPEPVGDGPLRDEAEAAETLRIYTILKAQRDLVESAFKAEAERLAERKREVLDSLDEGIEARKERMRQWHSAMVAQHGATKTLHMPTGVSKIRNAGPTLVVNDAAAARAWAQDQRTEDGERLSDVVWPARPRRDDELLKKALAEAAGLEAEEPGSPRPLMIGDQRVPGVTVLYPGNTWSGSGPDTKEQ